MRLIKLLTLLLFVSVAQSAPLTWVVNNALFDDGSSLTGSFSYDADTNTYTDIDLVTDLVDWSTEGELGASTSTELHLLQIITPYPSCEYRDVIEYPYCMDLNLQFVDPLTSGGGTVNLVPYSSYEWGNDYNNNTFGLSLVSGSVSAIPIPAAIWLFGSALAGLGWLRRKPTV
jgi:hypothetical protein